MTSRSLAVGDETLAPDDVAGALRNRLAAAAASVAAIDGVFFVLITSSVDPKIRSEQRKSASQSFDAEESLRDEIHSSDDGRVMGRVIKAVWPVAVMVHWSNMVRCRITVIRRDFNFLSSKAMRSESSRRRSVKAVLVEEAL